MEKNANNILDIHTHKSIEASRGRSIINYRLSADVLAGDKDGLYEGYFYSAGIHPWELTEENAMQQFDLLRQQIVKKQFVAVGEAGLDKLTVASMELQIAMFKKQVELSEALGMPLVIHCVKAMEELLAVKKECRPGQPWIWHGFRGKPQQAEQLLQSGFYLSFGAYYPEDTMKIVPAERLFLETDDSPVDIEELLHRAAGVRGVEVEALRGTIRKNIQNVFFSA